MTVFFAFRSRAQTMKFSSDLRKIGVQNGTVSTPRQISNACGLSVSVPFSCFSSAVALIKRNRYNTFMGAYRYNGGAVERLTLY